MDMLSWYKKHNLTLEAIRWIENMKKTTSYTDEEITSAIEETYRVGSKCGVTFEQAVAVITANETMSLTKGECQNERV